MSDLYPTLTTSPAAAGTGPLPAAAPFSSPDHDLLATTVPPGEVTRIADANFATPCHRGDGRMGTLNFVNFTPFRQARSCRPTLASPPGRQGSEWQVSISRLLPTGATRPSRVKDENSERIPAWLMPPADAANMSGRSPHEESRALAELIAGFRADYPQEWDQLRLTPLQHGLETIIERLRLAR